MKELKAVIVDDEPDSVSLLRLQLERHCPSIKQIISFNNPVRALEAIPQFAPDIIFADIEMPVINGFELLEQLLPQQFKVIFVTAFNQYAIRAFRFNALDYLLKPADVKELQEAVRKAAYQLCPSPMQLDLASQQLKGGPISRIALSAQNGITFINLSDIVYIEASNNYSRIYLSDNTASIISKTLKDVQELLEKSHFLRIHRQYIVNLNSVKHFNRNSGILTMDNKAELPIVRNQYDRFIEKYYRI